MSFAHKRNKMLFHFFSFAHYYSVYAQQPLSIILNTYLKDRTSKFEGYALGKCGSDSFVFKWSLQLLVQIEKNSNISILMVLPNPIFFIWIFNGVCLHHLPKVITYSLHKQAKGIQCACPGLTPSLLGYELTHARTERVHLSFSQCCCWCWCCQCQWCLFLLRTYTCSDTRTKQNSWDAISTARERKSDRPASNPGLAR